MQVSNDMKCKDVASRMMRQASRFMVQAGSGASEKSANSVVHDGRAQGPTSECVTIGKHQQLDTNAHLAGCSSSSTLGTCK
jgi:hypothetical protein